MAITNPLHPLSKDFAEQVRDHIRRMLARLDEIRSLAASPGAHGVWMPPVDVCEMQDAILVRVELPGIPSDHVRISMLDNVLKVEGRKERPKDTGKLLSEAERPIRFICLERTFGTFAFSIPLKWPIDVEKISANLADGVLRIRLPKTSACGREIAIQITE
jgi:HSP20 family molecular chaperone IbpA